MLNQIRIGWHLLIILLMVTVLLTACGGGGGGSGDTEEAQADLTSISGNVVAGPVSGATVNLYSVSATTGVTGSVIDSANSNNSGVYNISFRLGQTNSIFVNPILLQAGGGSYVDEATTNIVPLGTELQAIINDFSYGNNPNVVITPLTNMAVERAKIMLSPLIPANINAANEEVGAYFGGIDILHTIPINPLIADSSDGASQDAIDYGLILAGLSQLADTLGLTNPMDLVLALSSDFSDGNFNGMSDTGPVQLNGSAMDPTTGTTMLASAISSFNSNLLSNISGGSISPTLISQIEAAALSTFTISGVVLDENSDPVNNAIIVLVVNGIQYSTTSDLTGTYNLELDDSQAADLPSGFVVNAYEPTNHNPISTSFLLVGGRIVEHDFVLPTISGNSNLISIELDPDVHHLGNSLFSGSANAQFQYPSAEDISFLHNFSVSDDQNSFASANLSFIAKGIECLDEVWINSTRIGVLTPSDSSGIYDTYTIPFDPSILITGANNTFEFKSVLCNSVDYDDFEFSNAQINFI